MKAIQIETYGGPEVLRHVDLPVPVPKPGEVLVRVAHAGVNFMDVHTRQGHFEGSRAYPVRLPCTLGMEGAGTVVATGDANSRFAPGERVAWSVVWGSYAEYAVVPSTKLAKLAPHTPLDLAAAAIFPGSTAHYLIHDVARLKPGERCLVLAGSGGIGQLLIQWAKRRGARVYAVAGTPEKCEVARQAGADHVSTYDDGRFADWARDLSSGRGVDVVFDAIGQATLRHGFRAARTGGLVVNYGSVSGPVTDLNPLELGEAGSLYLCRPRLADHLADPSTVQRRADAVFAALADGTLRLPIAGRCTLDDVDQVHARLERREQVGKVVVDLPQG